MTKQRGVTFSMPAASQAPPGGAYVPEQAVLLQKPPQPALAQAARSSTKEVWLLQLPAHVSLDSLHGAHVELPGAAGRPQPMTVEGRSYQLLDETPGAASGASQVVVVLPGSQSQSVLPVKRRLVVAERSDAATGPLSLQGHSAPAPKKHKALPPPGSSDEDEAEDTQVTGTRMPAAQPITPAPQQPPAAAVSKKDKGKKDKKHKKEKKEKKEKKQKKDKKSSKDKKHKKASSSDSGSSDSD